MITSGEMVTKVNSGTLLFKHLWTIRQRFYSHLVRRFVHFSLSYTSRVLVLLGTPNTILLALFCNRCNIYLDVSGQLLTTLWSNS